MNIEDLTIKQARELFNLFGQHNEHFDNGMIGSYVLVRCRDAGVHAGVLVSHNGRECVLDNARRLWYWKPLSGKSFLSGVAAVGLHEDSKVGVTQPKLHLTENCEIALCTPTAAHSIMEAKEHVQ